MRSQMAEQARQHALACVWNWLQRASDRVFGYDYFISYQHADGKRYPESVARRLTKLGYRVFIDATRMPTGR